VAAGFQNGQSIISATIFPSNATHRTALLI
jgi:hypothetical protein